MACPVLLCNPRRSQVAPGFLFTLSHVGEACPDSIGQIHAGIMQAAQRRGKQALGRSMVYRPHMRFIKIVIKTNTCSDIVSRCRNFVQGCFTASASIQTRNRAANLHRRFSCFCGQRSVTLRAFLLRYCTNSNFRCGRYTGYSIQKLDCVLRFPVEGLGGCPAAFFLATAFRSRYASPRKRRVSRGVSITAVAPQASGLLPFR